jgi:hypothetical protein
MKRASLELFARSFRALFVCLLISPLAFAFAQVTVHFTGSITDSSGAALPGASIAIRNEQTDQLTTATSSADGTFAIDLPPGLYTITVSAPRYAARVLRQFAIAPDTGTSLKITLNRGATAAPRAPLPPPPPPPTPVSPNPPVPFPATESAPPQPGNHSVSGRSFLVGHDAEEPGYGLYSYLLFSSTPASDEERNRDLAVIQAFVDLLNDVSDLQSNGVTKAQINVTYLLVTENPKDKIPPADWVLTHYDYPRAKVLLRIFHHNVLGGPYVASSLTPLSQSATAPGHHLWQDMTHVPAAVAASWEKEFERRAARPEFWAPDTRDQALLALRDFISNSASGLTEVDAASASFKTMLTTWLSWK